MTTQQKYVIVLLSKTQHRGGDNMTKRKIHMPYNKFKVWLKDNGLTYSVISELLGITTTSVMLKINGQSDFLLSEAQLIKNTYNIGDDIFFTNYVA